MLRSLEPAAALRQAQVSVERHDDRRIKTVRAVRQVGASLEAVRDILMDHEGLSAHSSSLRRAQILDDTDVQESTAMASDRSLRVRQDLDLPFPLRDRYYVLEVRDVRTAPDCFESRWTSVPGSGNIEYTKGRWEILALENGAVLLAYVAEANPGGWVPAFATNWAARRAVPEVLSNVAAAAEASAAP